MIQIIIDEAFCIGNLVYIYIYSSFPKNRCIYIVIHISDDCLNAPRPFLIFHEAQTFWVFNIYDIWYFCPIVLLWIIIFCLEPAVRSSPSWPTNVFCLFCLAFMKDRNFYCDQFYLVWFNMFNNYWLLHVFLWMFFKFFFNICIFWMWH